MVVERQELRTTTISLSMLSSRLSCKLVETKVWELCMVATVNHRIRLVADKVQDMGPHPASVLLHLDTHLPRRRSMHRRVQALCPLHSQEEVVVELATLLLHLESISPRQRSHQQVQDSLLHHLPSLQPRHHSPPRVRDSVHHRHHFLHRHLDSHRAVQPFPLRRHDSRLLRQLTVLQARNTVRQVHNTRRLHLNTRPLVRNTALLARSIVLQVLSIARLALSIVRLALLCLLLLRLMKPKSRRVRMEDLGTRLVLLVSRVARLQFLASIRV
jgi:hypothetical protein